MQVVVYNNRYTGSLERQEPRFRLGDTPAVFGEARTWIMSPSYIQFTLPLIPCFQICL